MKKRSTQVNASTAVTRRRLGPWGISFLVISAAAPLTVVVSAAPMSFRLGGIGAPGAIFVAGIILALFAFGFTAMTRHVPNSGAFYAYALHGLGKSAGIGLALVTVFAYLVLNIAFYTFSGFFGSKLFELLTGANVPWWSISFVTLLFVGVLGARQIDIGAKVLAILVTAEIGILLAISIAVIVQGDPANLTFEPFTPQAIFFSGGASALFVIGFGAYLGFEGTAIYAEEATNPKQTIPRATYSVIFGLAAFYAFTFWITTLAFGSDHLLAFVAMDSFEDLLFVTAENNLGAWASLMITILVFTSFIACAISFHNASTRYIFSLARERLLPQKFATLDKTTQAPRAASSAISILCFVSVGIAAFFVADPLLGLALWTYATGVQGLVFSQAVAAISVVAFFLKDRRGHSVLRVLIAPTLGAIGLVSGFYLIVTNFEVISGFGTWINVLLLIPTPILFISGFIVSAYLKNNEYETWTKLGNADSQRGQHQESVQPRSVLIRQDNL